MTVVKCLLTAFLTVGILSVASAYTESSESGNKQISKAENVGEIGFGDPVCISGICTSQEDRDYYKIVPQGTVLGCLSMRESLAGSRISIWLLDSSGTLVKQLLSEYDREKNVEVPVSVGSAYYIYAQGTGPRYSFYNEKYEIWLACDGGGNPPADKTLTSISISGASTVTSGSGESYTCTAYYSDGSRPNVSPTWSIESGTSYASVNSSGRLTAYTVTSPQTVTLKASYGDKSTTKPITVNPKEDDNVMVTFNGNGGTVYNLAGQAVGPSIQLAQTPGTNWRNLPDATNGSKTFDGWWTQPSGGMRISTSDTFTGMPTTVYAHWKTPVTPTLSISPTTGDDVDWGGGAGSFSVSCNSSWSVSTSDAWITLNTRSGLNNGMVYFSYDDNDSSSSRLGKITVTCGSLTRTYQFVQLRRTVRIVWDANGGDIPGVDDPITEMTLGTTFRYPYSATSHDGAFVGWYTSRVGGIKVTSTTTVRDILDEDNPDEIVLYAHWRPWGSPSGLEYFACDEWWCDLGVRDLPFIAAGTHVVYGDGVDEILFVPSTSGWQTIWLHSTPLSSANGYLSVELDDERGESLAYFAECGKATVYLDAGVE